MLGLIRKDFLLLGKTISWLYFFSIVVFTFSCFQNPELLAMLLSVAVFFSASNLSVSTLVLDYQYKWEITVRSLPVKPQEVVLSKYISILILTVFALVLVFILEMVLAIVFSLSSITITFALVIGLSSTLLFCSVLLPVLYRYGTVKMQIAVVLYTAIMFLALMLITSQDLSGVLAVLFSNVWLAAVGIVVLSLIIFGVSYPISLRLFNRAFARE